MDRVIPLRNFWVQEIFILIIHPNVINEFSVLSLQFFQLMKHRVSVMPVVGRQNVPDRALSIFDVVAPLVVHGIWQVVFLDVIDLCTRFKLFAPIFEILIEQNIGSLIIQINFVHNLGADVCGYHLDRAQHYKYWNDL